MRCTTRSAQETISLGEKIGRQLQNGSVVCFFGDLAAGKTTLIKGIAKGAAGYSEDQVSSPTYVYLNIYRGAVPIYHFDLYRMKGIDEFLGMGFDEMLSADGISCIEWSERIADLLPSDCLRVEIAHAGDNVRDIIITPWKEG